jgi:hypothetical protein
MMMMPTNKKKSLISSTMNVNMNNNNNKEEIALTKAQLELLDRVRAAFNANSDHRVNIEDIYASFGWTSFKSATRVIRKNPMFFFEEGLCTTRPHPTVPKKVIYELTLEGFKALMRYANHPAMRSDEAAEYFAHSGQTTAASETSTSEDDSSEDDAESAVSSLSSSSGESDGEEKEEDEDEDKATKRRKRTVEEESDDDEDECDRGIKAKRRRRDSIFLRSVITEETIAAVMDKLADEAHKVQAANPECKFPVGVSPKTAEALGWADEYRNVICETKHKKTIVENRDYEVSILENRGCRVNPAPPVLCHPLNLNIRIHVTFVFLRFCRTTTRIATPRRRRVSFLPSMVSSPGARLPTTATPTSFASTAPA